MGRLEDLDERKLRMLDRRIDAFRIRDKGVEQRKVRDEVFDQATLLVFYKLISDGVLDSLDYVISSGKEAKVFHGTAPGEEPRAVKVYLVQNAPFRDVLPYIHGDPRFEGLDRNHRDLVMAWAKKEFGNLRELGDAGVRVPEPHVVERNVLVMEFLGDDDGPAPLLKEVDLPDPEATYADLADQLVRAAGEADLVHADVSEYNVLVWGGKPWLIDCAQAVPFAHPNAHEFLRRDLENLTSHFKKLGVDADADRLHDRILQEVEA